MPWIRFGRNEPPAPSLPLQNMQGQTVAVSDYRGQSSVALAFLHAPTCPACRGVIENWAARQAEVEALNSKLLLILPAAPDDVSGLDPAATLLDPQGQLRRRYAQLLEFDTEGQILVYVLDEFNTPYAAWVGAEPEGTIWEELLRWLLYVSLQCPE